MRYSRLIGLVLLSFGCQLREAPQPAFYHWQTQLSVDSVQRTLLDRLAVQRLYVKFFDIDWDASRQQLVPQAQLRVDTLFEDRQWEFVPCVFITNRSFLEATEAELAALPERFFRKIKALQGQLPLGHHIRELQIDCDWTAGSRAAFFEFLTKVYPMVRAEGWQLSVTIRLHQLADPKGTGLPPVDRGMLMFYNMGQLSSWEEANSVLNLTAARPYLSARSAAYPLPLDIALPVFNWGVLFRDGQFTQLLNNLDTTHLGEVAQYEKLAPYRYRVRQNTYLQGTYVYRDDLIRVETVVPEQLSAVRELLRPYLRAAAYISFYHLDAAALKQIPYVELEAFFDD